MTQSLEDYLETIYIILSEGRPAQVRDVARLLDVKMPSVVKAIHELKKLGLALQEDGITFLDRLKDGLILDIGRTGHAGIEQMDLPLKRLDHVRKTFFCLQGDDSPLC